MVLQLSIEEGFILLKPMFIYVVGMFIYAWFIFKFYKFLARRDIFHLNLKRYNRSKHPAMKKFFNVVLYEIEYIIFFPIFTFFWFSILTVLLSFLSREPVAHNIMLISVALVGAVRISAYYNEDLSKDLAKMLPFALLGIFLIDISYFSISQSLAAVEEIFTLWTRLVYYFIFVIAIEFILRIIHGFRSLFKQDIGTYVPETEDQ